MMAGDLLECEVKQVDGLGLDFAALAKVLEDDSRWVISQQKSLQLHFELGYMLINKLLTSYQDTS